MKATLKFRQLVSLLLRSHVGHEVADAVAVAVLVVVP